MEHPNPLDMPISRRSALVGLAAAGGTVVGMSALGATSAGAVAHDAASSLIDVGPATPAEVQRLFAAFLAAKSAANVDETMSFFSRTNTTYWDGTAGFAFPNWDATKAIFEQFMPNWPPTANSSASALLGSTTGAALFFTNTPEEFGHEIRGLSVVDIRDGKFVRWIDYWDGRHFTLAALANFKSPPSKFPNDFGWSLPGEQASSRLQQTVANLNGSLAGGDHETAAQLFAENGVLVDSTIHTAIGGPQSIDRYLTGAIGSLPYGVGANVRHVVGGDGGGAYEWTNAQGSVPRGATGVTLDNDGKILRFAPVWDGSLVTDDWLIERMTETIES